MFDVHIADIPNKQRRRKRVLWLWTVAIILFAVPFSWFVRWLAGSYMQAREFLVVINFILGAVISVIWFLGRVKLEGEVREWRFWNLAYQRDRLQSLTTKDVYSVKLTNLRSFLEDAVSAERKLLQNRSAEYVAMFYECDAAIPKLLEAWKSYVTGVKLGAAPRPSVDRPDPIAQFEGFENRLHEHGERAKYLCSHLHAAMQTVEFDESFADLQKLHAFIHDPQWHHELHALKFEHRVPVSDILSKRKTLTRVGGSYRVAPDDVSQPQDADELERDDAAQSRRQVLH